MMALLWPEHHMIWIHAAISLPGHKQADAFRDIAALTGRTFEAVDLKAGVLRKATISAALTRRVMVPGPAPKIKRANMILQVA